MTVDMRLEDNPAYETITWETAKGRTHYKVFKDETQDKTQTNIIQLSANERIMEIAEMIAGKNPSRSALDSAAEMLGSRL